MAAFNVLACCGWSAINVILGAQLLVAVNSKIPGYGGILVIAAGTSIISVFGYKIVHMYANWCWIPVFIVFLIVIGEFAHSGAFDKIPMRSGRAEAVSVLGFMASVFGFATGWTSLAADYAVYQPSNVSRVKVFAWTYAGLLFPLLFCQILGLSIATAIVRPSTDTFTNLYSKAYTDSGVGGLLGAVLLPPLGRFGQFCLVIVALSTIANNAANMYSLTFSLQVMGRWTQAVPRFIWSFLGTVVYCAIAIPGYSKFELILQDLMLLIVRPPPFPQPSPPQTNIPKGYWLSIYEAISLTEHFIFSRRRSPRYDISIYTSPSQLPPSIAAIAAACIGAAGAVLGMAQAWLTGPIGKRIGVNGQGGDVGFPLAFAFAASTYLGFRAVEVRVFGR